MIRNSNTHNRSPSNFSQISRSSTMCKHSKRKSWISFKHSPHSIALSLVSLLLLCLHNYGLSNNEADEGSGMGHLLIHSIYYLVIIICQPLFWETGTSLMLFEDGTDNGDPLIQSIIIQLRKLRSQERYKTCLFPL